VPRNLIVLVLDTLRADSVAGPDWNDVLPSAQVQDTMIASSPLTPPSHLALLAGEEPWEYFHRRPGTPTKCGQTGLATTWNRRGGESVAFSANPVVGPSSVLEGFARFNPGLPRTLPIVLLEGMGISDVALALTSRVLLPPSSAGAPSPPGWGTETIRVCRRALTTVPMLTRETFSSERVVQALKRYLPTRDQTRDLLLFINLLDAHEPYLPERMRDTTGDESNLPSFDLGFHSRQLADRSVSPLGFRTGYDRAATHAVHALQRIIELLREHRLLDDALVVVTSDHGQSLGENGFFGHGRYLYDQLVRVPLKVAMTPRSASASGPPRPLPEYVDHRHVFDLMDRYARGALGDGIGRTFQQSVDRRGPALSYFEGAPMSSDRVLARGDPYRLMRFTSHAASVTSQSDRAGVRTIDSTGDAEACMRLTQLMADRGWLNGHLVADAKTDLPMESVSRRLAEWGYH
jgi:Sulfatase